MPDEKSAVRREKTMRAEKRKPPVDDDKMIRQKNAVIRIARMLHERGLMVRTWGNVSRRSDRDHFIVTPSGFSYHDMTPENIVRVHLKKLTYRGKIKPSSEMAMHAAIYQMRPDAGFVIHTHQPYASCVSVLGEEEIRMTHDLGFNDMEDVVTFLPVASYAAPNTRELAEHVADAIERNPDCAGVILENHGVVCWGKNERQARARAESIEILCYTYLADMCHTALQYGVYERFSSVRVGGVISFDDPGTPERVKRIHRLIYAGRPDAGCILHAASEAEVIVSKRYTEMKPLFDDFAQIIGSMVRIPGNARETTGGEVFDIRKDVNVVFSPGDGAFCLGKDRYEAECAAKILNKACIAQIALTRLGKGHYLPYMHCRKIHKDYIRNYSVLVEKYSSKSATGRGREK